MTNKTIVSVDDDPFYRDLFASILGNKGFEVITCSNPEDGWVKIQESNPVLVTLDVMMPEAEGMFDGYSLLRRMRDSEEFRDVPVVMISALGDPEDAEHGLASGASAYLPKHEMTPESLVALVKAMLEK